MDRKNAQMVVDWLRFANNALTDKHRPEQLISVVNQMGQN